MRQGPGFLDIHLPAAAVVIIKEDSALLPGHGLAPAGGRGRTAEEGVGGDDQGSEDEE